jgi:hypothetical protein
MAYAHGKRLYNRGLAPQSILVRDPDGDAPRLQISNWQVASRSEGTSVGAAMTAGTLHVEDHLADPAKVYLLPDAPAVPSPTTFSRRARPSQSRSTCGAACTKATACCSAVQ